MKSGWLKEYMDGLTIIIDELFVRLLRERFRNKSMEFSITGGGSNILILLDPKKKFEMSHLTE